MIEELMKTKEAAEYLKISRKTLGKYVKNGCLPLRKLPSGELRFFKKDLDSLINKEFKGS